MVEKESDSDQQGDARFYTIEENSLFRIRRFFIFVFCRRQY